MEDVEEPGSVSKKSHRKSGALLQSVRLLAAGAVNVCARFHDGRSNSCQEPLAASQQCKSAGAAGGEARGSPQPHQFFEDLLGIVHRSKFIHLLPNTWWQESHIFNKDLTSVSYQTIELF